MKFSTRLIRATSTATITLLTLVGCGGTPTEPISPVNTSDKGVALKGYDAVAYFTDGKPTPGSEDITAEWQGATWQFASEENRTLFLENPVRYEPQYGGYCAYAVSAKSIADIDPEKWVIIDDKLYLNANSFAQMLWNNDHDANIEAADEHWDDYPLQSVTPMGSH